MGVHVRSRIKKGKSFLVAKNTCAYALFPDQKHELVVRMHEKQYVDDITAFLKAVRTVPRRRRALIGCSYCGLNRDGRSDRSAFLTTFGGGRRMEGRGEDRRAITNVRNRPNTNEIRENRYFSSPKSSYKNISFLCLIDVKAYGHNSNFIKIDSFPNEFHGRRKCLLNVRSQLSVGHLWRQMGFICPQTYFIVLDQNVLILKWFFFFSFLFYC